MRRRKEEPTVLPPALDVQDRGGRRPNKSLFTNLSNKKLNGYTLLDKVQIWARASLSKKAILTAGSSEDSLAMATKTLGVKNI